MIMEQVLFIMLSLGLIIITIVGIINEKDKPESIVILVAQILSFVAYIILFVLKMNQIYLYINLIVGILVPIAYHYISINEINIKEEIMLFNAKMAYNRGEYIEALDIYQGLAKVNKKNGKIHYMMGMIYKAQDDFIASRDEFGKAVELGKNDYKSYYELGMVLSDMGKKDMAIVVLNNALRINPEFFDAADSLAMVLVSMGKCEEAIRVYKDAEKHNGNRFELYYNLAVIYSEMLETAKAEEYYKKAIEFRPNLYEAYYSLGQICFFRGEYDSAIKYYNDALLSTYYAPRTYYQLAKIYAIKEDYAKCIGALEYAMKMEPEYRQKSATEPLFNNIKDFLLGLNQVMEKKVSNE